MKHLATINYDHSLILINIEGESVSRMKAAFKFQATWLTHKDLAMVVDQNWNREHPIMDYTKKMSTFLTEWNKKVFGNIHHKLKKNDLGTDAGNSKYSHE